MRKIILLISTTCCFFLSASALADNYSFLRDAPASYFTDEDYAMLKATADKALTKNVGVKTSWKNPATGASGYFIVKSVSQENGTTCKQLTQYSQAEQRTGLTSYKVCKIQNKWQIVD